MSAREVEWGGGAARSAQRAARSGGTKRPSSKRRRGNEADGGGGKDGDADSSSEESNEEEAAEEEQESAEAALRRMRVPVSHELVLREGAKTVAALALDPSGSRLASGGADNTVRLWDFGGMDRGARSFRSFEPEEGHPVLSLSYSPSGDRLLAVTGAATPAVYDRDGALVRRFCRGDAYIHDVVHTKVRTSAASFFDFSLRH